MQAPIQPGVLSLLAKYNEWQVGRYSRECDAAKSSKIWTGWAWVVGMVAGRVPASDIDYDSQKLYGAAVHSKDATAIR